MKSRGKYFMLVSVDLTTVAQTSDRSKQSSLQFHPGSEGSAAGWGEAKTLTAMWG